jgi:hypothetical protein
MRDGDGQAGARARRHGARSGHASEATRAGLSLLTTLPSRRARLPRARPPMESPTALASSFLVVHAFYLPRPLTHPSPPRSRPYHVLSSATFFTVLFSFCP